MTDDFYDELHIQSSEARWTPSLQKKEGIKLDKWLAQHKPSVTKGYGPWIWVTMVDGDGHAAWEDPPEVDAAEEQMEEAKEMLEKAKTECQAIKDDPSIPTMTSKAKGLSKKARTEEITQHLTKKLRGIGERIDTCGKWLFFASEDYVNKLYADLALGLETGELSKLVRAGGQGSAADGARTGTIKVSAADHVTEETPRFVKKGGDPNPQKRFPICVFFQDCWKREHALEVLRACLLDTGVEPSACKPNLYTHIGLTSTTIGSSLRSSIWTPRQLMTEEDKVELLEERKKRQLGKAHTKLKGPDDDDDGGFQSDEGSPKRDKGKGKSTSTKSSAVVDDGNWPKDPREVWPDPPGGTSSTSSKEQKKDTSTAAPASSSPIKTGAKRGHDEISKPDSPAAPAQKAAEKAAAAGPAQVPPPRQQQQPIIIDKDPNDSDATPDDIDPDDYMDQQKMLADGRDASGSKGSASKAPAPPSNDAPARKAENKKQRTTWF